MFVYLESQDDVYSVGHYTPAGRWIPESDHATEDAAADRVALLNGSVKAGGFDVAKFADALAGLEDSAPTKAAAATIAAIRHALQESTGMTVKKQVARQLKATCPKCGYVIRVTRKWLNVGVPTCCCGTKFVAPPAADDPDDVEAEK